ncbi:MAG: polysaccharide deacetylase family protein [Deltaproteobacteria bacterium]|nr:polysaccharide deacetylase family protein [Deltaproteobacteria bacterium]
MIDLLARDELGALGLQAVLELEKIPYRRVAAVDEAGASLLVAVGELASPAEIAAIERIPSLVLGGGERFAREVFGAPAARTELRACAIELDQPIWPAATAAIAREHDKRELRLPAVPALDVPEITRGTLLATLAGSGRPAIARRNGCIWSPLDLGTAFAKLTTEDDGVARKPPARGPWRGAARRAAETLYYAAPDALRGWVQRRAYATLDQRLAALGARASDYPIDATGHLLVELVKQLVKLAAGSLVRMARWPAPYHAAASLTHDVEPRRYAYTRGMERLLDAIEATGHPATLGLVAGPAARHLHGELVRRLVPRRVLCHGLEHRGERVWGRQRVAATLERARARLERTLGRAVTGYRSPRLDRSPDLAWALDRTGFRYDSSYPDVDRENLANFGRGVRLNVPFRPVIDDGVSGPRPSRCLELPLTAPDCIQPLFAGESRERLRQTVETKAAFLAATGGLYVALVHGGVFDEADADLRMEHLEFVYRKLRRGDVWLAGMEDIADWWCRREALTLTVKTSAVHVANTGSQPVAGARVVIERAGGDCVLNVPPLPAGAQIALVVPRSHAVPAA